MQSFCFSKQKIQNTNSKKNRLISGLGYFNDQKTNKFCEKDSHSQNCFELWSFL